MARRSARHATKRQRLLLAVLAVIALAGAGTIAAFAMKDRAAYFQTPADIAAHAPDPDRTIRLGGLVEKGSVRRSEGGLVLHFVVTDTTGAETPVRYRGLVPDLFREDSGVVATGRVAPDGTFMADELLAKHDENYEPPEVAKAIGRDGSGKPAVS